MRAYLRVTLSLLIWLPRLGLAAPLFAHATASKELIKAHIAYLRQDFPEAMELIKSQLENHPEDQLAKNNALRLVNQIFVAAPKKQVDLKWHLPHEFSLFQINTARTDRDGRIYFRLTLRADGSFKRIDQIRIVQFPSKVFLDKEGGIGACRQYGRNPKGFNDRITCSSPILSAPLADGLYRLAVGFDGGKRSEGWFILSELTPERSPRVLSPSINEDFFTSRPTFKWTDYLPEPGGVFTDSYCTMYVTPQDNQATRWFLRTPVTNPAFVKDPFVADTDKVGSLIGASQLDTGEYVLSVKCDDTRRFGDLTLAGERHAIRSFTIRRP